MFFENISWCMQVQNSKQGFDNISHLQWHVNQTSLKHLHPNQIKKIQRYTHMDISAMGGDLTFPKLNNEALHSPSFLYSAMDNTTSQNLILQKF